ncbi:MAG: TonB-dependent receptor [Acidobacteria bacterium]|nr:TonB-dependent receptor [Acidobacteriota bacterium]
MTRSIGSCVALFVVLLFPSLSYAQASITGTVRDTSGGVLPGVTVEASSPALIEKVRSVVTDGSGRYQILDLRPGSYVVAFTLPGFTTVRQEGVQLTGSFTATVNAEMGVGALAETITVAGEAQTVDVQSATRQEVLQSEVINALPTGRHYSSLAVLIPGVSANNQAIGGLIGDGLTSLTTHGSKASDMRIQTNGIRTGSLQASGNVSMAVPNVGSAQEVTVDLGAGAADAPTSGVRVNFVPRDGGNDLTGFTYLSFANEDMQGNNLTARLVEAGLRTPDSLSKVWDLNFGTGGPIQRDRIWFYFTGRYNGQHMRPPGIFVNRNANDPNAWTYEPDLSQPAFNKVRWFDGQLRTTWQATPRNKIAFTYNKQDRRTHGWYASATRSPEAGSERSSPQSWVLLEYSSPATNRLLIEGVLSRRFYKWGNYEPSSGGWASATRPEGMIGVEEQSTGLIYRGGIPNTGIGPGNHSESQAPDYQYRWSVSYITGSHALKVGGSDTIGYLRQRFFHRPPISYRFNNGVPNQVRLVLVPFEAKNDLHHDLGLYAQDRWTKDRLTLTFGIRYDMVSAGVPEQHIGPAPLAPNRNITFPADDYLNWKDISPRSAVVYDIFGTGRTAAKISLSRYVGGQGLSGLGGFPTNPASNLVNVTTRNWNDANRNYVVDCDLLNPNANGECAPMANRNFGTLVSGATFDQELLNGWGKRLYNWEFSTGIQHELLPRVSVDVSYFRRWYGNFEVTDNLALEPGDFNRFSLVAPATDSRLPSAGQTLEGYYALSPAKFGVPARVFHTLSDNYGKQIEHWNGVDVSVNARLQNGVVLQGGISTGRTSTDNCEIVRQSPELLGSASERYCHQDTPFLTQAKAFAVYTIPRVDVQVSGTFQSLPGPDITANFTASNAYLAANSTLGRPLAGGAQNITLNLVRPGTLYGERVNQLDVRFAKVFRFGGRRATINVDLYNALNADTVLAVNNAFAVWQRPTQNIQARYVTIGGLIDF